VCSGRSCSRGPITHYAESGIPYFFGERNAFALDTTIDMPPHGRRHGVFHFLSQSAEGKGEQPLWAADAQVVYGGMTSSATSSEGWAAYLGRILARTGAVGKARSSSRILGQSLRSQGLEQTQVYAFINIDLVLHFCVPPTRLEKPDATATAPSAILTARDGKGRGAGPSSTAAPFFGS
jgi:hypothetical protein